MLQLRAFRETLSPFAWPAGMLRRAIALTTHPQSDSAASTARVWLAAFGLLAPPNAPFSAFFSLFGQIISDGFGLPPTSPNPTQDRTQPAAMSGVVENPPDELLAGPSSVRENMIARVSVPSNTRPKRPPIACTAGEKGNARPSQIAMRTNAVQR